MLPKPALLHALPNTARSLTDKMLRYQENNELHRDFHGTTNTTLTYIADNFGEDALKEILRATGRDVYKSIHDKLANGDASELLEHINWFYFREGAKYKLDVTENEIRLEVFECPAIRHIKKMGWDISPYSCLQTSEVKVCGEGHCVQIFRRKDGDK